MSLTRWEAASHAALSAQGELVPYAETSIIVLFLLLALRSGIGSL